jgi:hypothetical protein
MSVVQGIVVFEKLCGDAPETPDVCLGIVLLSSYDHFRGPIKPIADVWGHASYLFSITCGVFFWHGSGPAKVTDLNLAVCVD